MYTLYYAPRFAAMGARALRQILRVPYIMSEVDIACDGPRNKNFLHIHPNGWMPALAYEGDAMPEASAIAVYLSHRLRKKPEVTRESD